MHRATHTGSFLGIDLGTSGLKLCLVAADGTVQRESEATYEVRASAAGYAETDPADWEHALRDALRRLWQPGEEAEVAAVAVTGQMHGVVLAGPGGRPLRPALLVAGPAGQRGAAPVGGLARRRTRAVGQPAGGRHGRADGDLAWRARAAHVGSR